MTSQRQRKKHHTRLLADYLLDCSSDPVWTKKLQSLPSEDTLQSSVDGFPDVFLQDFPEANSLKLCFSIEQVALSEIPRDVSCRWPDLEGSQFFMAYPTEFPQAAIYLAIDFDEQESLGNS